MLRIKDLSRFILVPREPELELKRVALESVDELVIMARPKPLLTEHSS